MIGALRRSLSQANSLMVGRRIARPWMFDLNGKSLRPGMLVATLLFDDGRSVGTRAWIGIFGTENSVCKVEQWFASVRLSAEKMPTIL
jgi:hypothetical protein